MERGRQYTMSSSFLRLGLHDRNLKSECRAAVNICFFFFIFLTKQEMKNYILLVFLHMLERPVTCEGVMCKPVQELGNFGIIPWGSASFFADPTAKWIATSFGSTNLYLSYRNDYHSAIAGKLHIIGDVQFEVFLNGVNLGDFGGVWNNSAYTRIPAKFRQVKSASRVAYKWAC